MFVELALPVTGKRLNKTGLTANAGPLLREFYVSTHNGAPGLRPRGYDQTAWRTRQRWNALEIFVANTGFVASIETTKREADALMVGGHVRANGGRYTLDASGVRSTQPGQVRVRP